MLFWLKSYDEKSFELQKASSNAEFHFHDFSTHYNNSKNGARQRSGFVRCNDDLSRDIARDSSEGGTKLIAIRCAGFDKVDLDAAKEFGLQVVHLFLLIHQNR
ncbi:hypothetical protein O9992_24750 [Vibrio lentus]|nr:hypothetical protein [Vibrio lentus]